MSGTLVVNTRLGTTGAPSGIAEQINTSYPAGSTITHTLLLQPAGKIGAQYISAVGFSVLTVVTSGSVQLTAQKSSTTLSQVINQTATIDDTVDSFQLTNLSTTTAVSVDLIYVVAVGAASAIPGVVTSVNGQVGAVVIPVGLLPSYLVSALPVESDASVAYATNGRKIGESVGAGTGVPVYLSVGVWRTYNDQPVQA